MTLIKRPLKSDFIIEKAFNNELTFHDICHIYIISSIAQTSELSKSLLGIDTRDTAKKIYDFCRANIKYHLDDDGLEQIRLPRQTWKDRKKGVDCEDFVIFCSSILCNLNESHTIRMADYGNGWQHIYIVLGTNNSITLDPTLSVFNKEFKAKKTRNYSIKFKKRIQK